MDVLVSDKYSPLPLVSVFMPVYNQESYVAAAIDSVLQQTYENLEIVISDDCSHDLTPAIVKQYAEKFPGKIKFYKLADKNLGKDHFEALLKKCTGEYVCMFAGDDLMYPQKIYQQINKTLELDLSFHGHSVDCINNEGDVFGKISSGKNIFLRGNWRLIFSGVPVAGCSWLFKKSCIEIHGALGFLHDFDIVIRCLRLGRRGYIDKDILGAYRVTQTSWSRNLRWRDYLIAYKNLLQSWVNAGMYSECVFLFIRVLIRVPGGVVKILKY